MSVTFSFIIVILIGFEQETYTVFEAFNISGDKIPVPVIKGNNLQSELQFDVIAQFRDGTAVRETPGMAGDYFTSEPRITLSFIPNEQLISFTFILVIDDLAEPEEEFSIELTVSGAPRVVIGQGGGPFGRASVVIMDAAG